MLIECEQNLCKDEIIPLFPLFCNHVISRLPHTLCVSLKKKQAGILAMLTYWRQFRQLILESLAK